MTDQRVPFKDETKSENLHVKITPSEQKWYKHEADKARMTLTQWVKYKLGYWPDED